MLKSKRNALGAIVSTLQIDMMRTCVEVFLQADGISQFAGEALLCTAMFMAQAEGKPMTAAKIASYIGMPRPSAVRKLQSLKQRGIVEQMAGKKWRVRTDENEIDSRVDAALDAQMENVRRAIYKLSRVDSMSIAGQKRRT